MNILHKLHTDTVRPKRHSRLGYGSPGESTHNRTALSNRQPINRRHTNRRNSPMPEYPTTDYPTPATPTSVSLEVLSPAAHRASVTSPRTSLASGNYLRDVWVFPVHQRGSPSYYPSRAGVPYKHRRFYLLTPDSAEYWVACADRPHNPLTQQLHVYPSPYILINPSADQIHHLIYNIVHIRGTNNEQFTIPVIPNDIL